MMIMTNKMKRESENRFKDIQSGEDPSLDELRRRLSEQEPLGSPQGRLWAQRFRRLTKAIVGVAGPQPAQAEPIQRSGESAMSCEECQAVLDLYLDEVLEGHEGRSMYPAVWQHLQTCAHCREAYDLLIDTLTRERRGELPRLRHRVAPRLSFLRPHSADAPWTTRLRSRLAGAPFGLAFSFNLAYLQTLLSPPVAVPARMEKPISSPATHLLLSDTVPVGEQTLAVEVMATRHPEQPDRLVLQALIIGSASLPESLGARLTWAGQTRTALVDADGQVDFGEVSLANLQAALETGEGRFEIAFEAPEEQESRGA
jgi:hypothetical protein